MNPITMSNLPKLIFATQNRHKVLEIEALFKNKFQILTLNDLGFTDDIPETGSTFRANAELKAKFVYNRWQADTFADDSGLEVDALNGAPGVYSARYAGIYKNEQANVQKLLKEMRGKTNRKARFVTVIGLILQGKLHFFKGEAEGAIAEEIRGNNGFGYDPVFIPNGFDKTFAEITAQQKNSLSHRAMALAKMTTFLNAL